MFECHVCGGELLVIAEEGLDLAVLDGDAVFEDQRVWVVGPTTVEEETTATVFDSGEWDLDFAVVVSSGHVFFIYLFIFAMQFNFTVLLSFAPSQRLFLILVLVLLFGGFASF